MKIFITGATGFIGTHLVKKLAKTSHEMHCLVRNPDRAESLKELGANLVTGDVTNRDSILEGMKGCQYVIHLANVYSFWEPDNEIYSRVNVEGTRNVMECALEVGVSKVIHVSSVVIYGKPDNCPFCEESQVGPVRFSEYARTKYQGDLIAWELHKKKGLPLVVIYPAAVTGPGDPKPSGKYILNLINRRFPAAAFKNSYITWVYVGDVAEAILRALQKENNIGEKYIIGKFAHTYKEINQMLSEIAGVPVPRLYMPNWMAMLSSHLFTWVANITRKPPIWEMSVDSTKTQIEGFRVDGSKAERELNLNYTPVHVAFEKAVDLINLNDSK